MGRKYLIPEKGTFYKANLHCHTTVSDGCMTPEQVKELYVRHGYSIVAYTDHNVYAWHKELADGSFLPLAGYEANNDGMWQGGNLPGVPGQSAAGNRPGVECQGTVGSLPGVPVQGEAESLPGGPARSAWGGHQVTSHLCAIAIDPEKARYVGRPMVYDIDRINEMIEEMRSAGFLVNYNHPCWSAEHTEDILRLEGITCFEVFNYGAEISGGNGYGDQQYDLWLKSGKWAWAIAADDNHNSRLCEGDEKHPANEFDACGGFTMIKAGALTYQDIMEAIQAGNLYASNGPLIHALYVEDDRLCIDCSPVCTVLVKDDRLGTADMAIAAEDTLTHAEFPLGRMRTAGSRFVRIVLRTRSGLKAWSNPYRMEELG